MEHNVHPTASRRDALERAQISLDQFDVEIRKVRVMAGGEVVEQSDVISTLEQSPGQIRADEPCATCDQCSHSSLPRASRSPDAESRQYGLAAVTEDTISSSVCQL